MVVQFYQKSWPANLNCVCSHMNVPNDNMRRGRPMAGSIFYRLPQGKAGKHVTSGLVVVVVLTL